MRERVRVAIIGCGGIAAFTHIPQLLNERDKAEIVYLCDTRSSRVEVLKSRFNLRGARSTADYREALADDSIEAVILAAWPVENGRIALDAVARGKHLLLQKPLIMEEGRAEELLALSLAAPRQVLALPFIEPLEQFALVRRIVEAGDLGELGFARLRTAISGPADYYEDVTRFFGEERDKSPYFAAEYASGRGCLSDMGPYALTAYHYLFGPALCVSSVFWPGGLDRSVALTLVPDPDEPRAGPRPPVSTVEVGWSQIEGTELCSVFGSGGTVCVEASGRVTLHKRSGSEELFSPAATMKRLVLPMSPFHAQKAWLGAIVAGEPPRFAATVRRAVWVARTIDKAYESRAGGH